MIAGDNKTKSTTEDRGAKLHEVQRPGLAQHREIIRIFLTGGIRQLWRFTLTYVSSRPQIASSKKTITLAHSDVFPSDFIRAPISWDYSWTARLEVAQGKKLQAVR